MGGVLMIELTRFYEVWVWLKEEEEDKIKVTMAIRPPLTPMAVKGWCCVKGIFRWKDYQRIRYRRVSKTEERR